jgi:hypothetical protein
VERGRDAVTVEAVGSGAARRPWSRSTVLAWAVFALTLLALGSYPWLDGLMVRAGRPDLGLLIPFAAAPTLAAVTASAVGLVLASRRPRHPVGWLLMALGLVMVLSGVAAAYAPYGLAVRPGALPAAGVVARLYSPAIEAALAILGFVVLLTPTGSPPTPGWRRWGQVSAVAMAVLLVAATIAPGTIDPQVLAEKGPQDPRTFGGVLLAANLAAQAFGIVVILAGAASMVVRFRRARGVERLQLRWLVLAGALTGAAMLAAAVLIAGGNVNLGAWASVLCTLFLPLATGAAILRYRLYDIDRIVSRTLAYGLLTVLLGGSYALVVLGLGQLLGRDSTLVVAGATLAAAALFQPLRRRTQQAVDRRFNRRRHDAARFIEAFGARLRDQVDLDTLTAEVLAVVDQTMQPTRAWLWQRPPPGPGVR